MGREHDGANGPVARLRHGFTLAELHDLARRCARTAWWGRHLPAAERVEVALSAMAERLYAQAEAPSTEELKRVAWRAITEQSRQEMMHRGLETNHRPGTGAHTAAFERYWALSAAPTASPEGGVVERMALWQIWAELRPAHRRVLAALALHEDYAKAAAALGKPASTFRSGIAAARRAFWRLWHEGEQPAGLWGCDRRVGRDQGASATRVAKRRRANQRRLAREKQQNPLPARRERSPVFDVGVSEEELRRRYASGESIRTLAKTLGVSYARLKAHMKALGIPMRYGQPTSGQLVGTSELVRRYQSGQSVPQIAKELGIDSSSIYKRLKLAGAKTGRRRKGDNG